ncbi:hypothetical protein NUU61_009544 [Penicillium alfredii]|uniref:Uncharacterized protein n=1 Tax=Penicillium alfredii TaxID=1506179 RepID=A0A9W9EGH8_9EURO|nr:uncharacterized protein NUU61_009544 [Penicillium alfredii]KAJ5081280.1 hypothetical protein NUU61_009544 [Penicillium alfredii]
MARLEPNRKLIKFADWLADIAPPPMTQHPPPSLSPGILSPCSSAFSAVDPFRSRLNAPGPGVVLGGTLLPFRL